MAKQEINIGTSANDGTGDPLRTAFQKAKANFDELYDELHYLGEYATLSALQTAYPTADAGDYAIVNTDGVSPIQYVWDEGDSEWTLPRITVDQVIYALGQANSSQLQQLTALITPYLV
jgi:hypothetical protein